MSREPPIEHQVFQVVQTACQHLPSETLGGAGQIRDKLIRVRVFPPTPTKRLLPVGKYSRPALLSAQASEIPLGALPTLEGGEEG